MFAKCMPRNPLVPLVFLMVLLGVRVSFGATSFYAETPSNKISASEALKLGATGKPIFKCESIRPGPNVNPVKVKGSTATWHTTVPEKGIDAPALNLAEGKKTIRCSEMYVDADTARVRKVQE